MATFTSPTNTPLNISEEDAIQFQGGTKDDPYKGLRSSGYKEAKTEVGMIDTGSAISTVNKQKGYMDSINSVTPLSSTTNVAPAPTSTTTPKTTESTGKARFTNQAGQDLVLSEEQLKDRTTQDFIKNNGFVVATSDFPVNNDFTTSSLKKEVSDIDDQVEGMTKSMMNLNLDSDPEYASIAQSIKSQFAEVRTQMEAVNRQRQKAFETLGSRYGTQQYAGNIQMGIEGEEIKQGTQRISDINAKESEALITARQAFKTGKWQEFNNVVNSLKSLREEKTKELGAYNQSIANLNRRLQEEQIQVQSDVKEGQLKQSILGAINQGFKDPIEILSALEMAGIQATPEEVSKYTNLIEKQDTLAGLDQDLRTYEFLKKNEPEELSALGVASYKDFLRATGDAKRAVPTGSKANSIRTSSGGTSDGGSGSRGNSPTLRTELSDEAAAVISGTLRLEDLTPTTRGKIAGELTRAGYKSLPKLSAGQQEEIATMSTVSKLIDDVLDYNSDGILEGIGAFGVGTLKESLSQIGLGGKEGQSVRALMGNIKGTVAKLRGGTSFTPNEEKLLNSYTPSINDNPIVAINKLRLLKDFIAEKNQSLVKTATERGVPTQENTKQAEDLRTKYNY